MLIRFSPERNAIDALQVQEGVIQVFNAAISESEASKRVTVLLDWLVVGL